MKKKEILIYHNPRCSKSREALSLLEAENCTLTVKEYLKTPISKKELKDLLMKLGISASDLVRKKEKLFLEKFKNKNFTEDEWQQILIENPVLIERPMVVDGYKAIVGRPPELVLDLLKRKSN